MFWYVCMWVDACVLVHMGLCIKNSSLYFKQCPWRMIQNVWIFQANLWIHQWQLLGESFPYPILNKQEQENEVCRYCLHKVDMHRWLLACYGKHSWVSSPSHMYLFVGTQFWDFSYLSNLIFLFLVHHILILTHIVLYLYLYTLTFIWILSTNQHSWYFQWRIYVFSFSFPKD